MANSNLVPNNMISISTSVVTFGKRVADYFDKRNISYVVFIFDYNNNSLIIKAAPEEYGIKIQKSIDKDRWNKFASARIIKFIDFSSFGNINFSRKAIRFSAKPLTRDSIILENLPLKRNYTSAGSRISVDVDSKILTLGYFTLKSDFEFKINPNELVRQPKPQSISPVVKNNLTSTSSSTKTIQSIQNYVPVVNKDLQNHIVDKESGSYKVHNTPSENSPTPEELDRADKAYARMILGE